MTWLRKEPTYNVLKATTPCHIKDISVLNDERMHIYVALEPLVN